MSSGLNWDESYGTLFNTTTEAYYGKNVKEQIYGQSQSITKIFHYLTHRFNQQINCSSNSSSDNRPNNRNPGILPIVIIFIF